MSMRETTIKKTSDFLSTMGMIILFCFAGFMLYSMEKESQHEDLKLAASRKEQDDVNMPGLDHNKPVTARHLLINDNVQILYKYIVQADGFECGTVYKFEGRKLWEAESYHDFSTTHYFTNAGEAEYWLEHNWCPTTETLKEIHP